VRQQARPRTRWAFIGTCHGAACFASSRAIPFSPLIGADDALTLEWAPDDEFAFDARTGASFFTMGAKAVRTARHGHVAERLFET
jgi:hypothetical protein